MTQRSLPSIRLSFITAIRRFDKKAILEFKPGETKGFVVTKRGKIPFEIKGNDAFLTGSKVTARKVLGI